MKHNITHSVILCAALATAGVPALVAQTHNRPGAPVIITPPAVQDGSNRSRAPFPAERRADDVTPPNGMAFDQNVPPNTPSTNPEPFAPPPAAVAILQPRVEPGTLPTGHPSTGLAVAADVTTLQPMIRNATFESREQMVDNIESHLRSADNTLGEFRRTESEMTASGRTQFTTAADDVRAKEKALKASIKAARRASAANWESARAQLAADFDAYAAALNRVDATVGIAPAQR